MYRRILVPLDGTRFGDHALPHAVDIARRTGAMIELVHVHQHAELDAGLIGMPQYQFQHIAEADAAHDEAVLRLEQSNLEATAADLELRYGVRVVTRVLPGTPGLAVLKEAQDSVADLIVLATHARQGLSRFRYGSMVHELIGHLNVPAICVRPDSASAPLAAAPLRRILIALDGSTFSEQVLDVVAPLAAQLGAQPTLLHVVTPHRLLAAGVAGTEQLLATRDQAIGYLHDVAVRYRDRMPEPVLAALEDAQPARLISGLLATGEYDLVALATHGRSGLTRLLIGSVADEVLRTASRPVLLYRPRAVRLPDDELATAFRIYGSG